jgi:hypothetical protein
MKDKIIMWIILACLITSVEAYDNSTKTAAYLKLTNNDPVHAIHDSLTGAWGDWLWLILVGTPYIGMLIVQRNMNIATMWLTCCLVAYGGLLQSGMVPMHVFYLLGVLWAANVFVKLLSTIYQN